MSIFSRRNATTTTSGTRHTVTDKTASGSVALSVQHLGIDFWTDGEWNPAAIDVTFDLHRGEILAIVGESGSGKSTTAMSLIGLLPKNSRTTGSIKLAGHEIVNAKPSMLHSIRGQNAAVIFQEPMTALNPVYTIGYQIAEVIRSHEDVTPKQARARALELLAMVEIPDPQTRIDSYPHQLSGGQRQRAMIAQALACDPALLIADEPTTALDVTVQAEILSLMRSLRDRTNAAIILITHDMGVVADLADTMLVMRKGEVVERGTAEQIFTAPVHPYTRELLASVPHLGNATDLSPQHRTVGAHAATASADVLSSNPALLLTDIDITYPGKGGRPGFKAVEDVSFHIDESEVVGLVGESGSGKSTIGRAVVGLLRPSAGTMQVVGYDVMRLKGATLARMRDDVSIVFQDPGSSLNPRFPIGESIGEPLRLRRKVRGKALDKRVEELLSSVELPTSLRNRYPHELSGGQRQRVGIARALALGPKLLVADEPTSALDVSVQAKVLSLFADLQQQYGFACLFISHDLAVIEQVASRVIVMNHGELVEIGSCNDVLYRPQHDYTKRLLAAVPVPDPAQQRRRREARELAKNAF